MSPVIVGVTKTTGIPITAEVGVPGVYVRRPESSYDLIVMPVLRKILFGTAQKTKRMQILSGRKVMPIVATWSGAGVSTSTVPGIVMSSSESALTVAEMLPTSDAAGQASALNWAVVHLAADSGLAKTPVGR